MAKATRKPPQAKRGNPVPQNGNSRVTHLMERITFSSDGVVQAAAEQPELFLKAAEYRVDIMRRRVQKRTELESTRAQEALEARRSAEESGQKVTEGRIEELVRSSRSIMRLREELDDLEVLEEFSKLLLSAYHQRRECLRIVSELTGAELAMEKVHAMQTQSLHEARSKVRSKYREAAYAAGEDDDED